MIDTPKIEGAEPEPEDDILEPDEVVFDAAETAFMQVQSDESEA